MPTHNRAVPPLVLGFAECAPQAQALAGALGAETALVQVHRFPDGESRVTVPATIPAEVVLLRSLDRPNDKLIELLLAVQTLRAAGARSVTLLAPYLCYMRQDDAFNPGEAISQTIVCRFLAGLVDRLVTVDPHLHRVGALTEVVPGWDALTLSAAPLLGRFIAAHQEAPILVGPDAESAQWVARVAAVRGFEYRIGTKRRSGDRDVEICLPTDGLAGRRIVLVDDVLSTGRTLMAAARAVRAAGAIAVDAAVTHALYSDDAGAGLAEAGIDEVWSTDSIPHPSNRVALAPLLAAAL